MKIFVSTPSIQSANSGSEILLPLRFYTPLFDWKSIAHAQYIHTLSGQRMYRSHHGTASIQAS